MEHTTSVDFLIALAAMFLFALAIMNFKHVWNEHNKLFNTILVVESEKMIVFLFFSVLAFVPELKPLMFVVSAMIYLTSEAVHAAKC